MGKGGICDTGNEYQVVKGKTKDEGMEGETSNLMI